MKRKAEADLFTWFNKKTRMPLILRGARQVGKSTLVRLFCEKHNIHLIEINLELHSFKVLARPSFRLNDVLEELEIKTGQSITKNSLIFLDEIQADPKLLSYLRYFFEERPDIPVIAAGSLLEITLKTGEFSFPVGRVEFYHLGPMTFTEFLWATGKELLSEKIMNLEMSSALDEACKKDLAKFLYIGGMPRAVKTYVEEKSLLAVRSIQEQILQTYMADFPKYNNRVNVERVQRIFSASVNQVGQKVIYQRFDHGAQSRDIKRVIELLLDARVLLAAYHSDANTIPLAGESDPSVFKLYFLDVGLLNAILRLDPDIIDEEMRNDFNNKGMMMEQFVAQHLVHFDGNGLNPSLYYWLRDKGSQKGEIDFLVQKKQKIVPIEVKATGAGHLKSAFYFAKEKKSHSLVRVSTLPFKKETIRHKIGDKYVTIEKVDLPAYAIEGLMKVIEEV